MKELTYFLDLLLRHLIKVHFLDPRFLIRLFEKVLFRFFIRFFLDLLEHSTTFKELLKLFNTIINTCVIVSFFIRHQFITYYQALVYNFYYQALVYNFYYQTFLQCLAFCYMNNVTALKILKIDCVFVFFLNSSWSVRIQVQPQRMNKNEKILTDKHG